MRSPHQCKAANLVASSFLVIATSEAIRVALHYAYYNFVKSNIAIRCTPAMAAGVTNRFWTVRDLVEMVEA